MLDNISVGLFFGVVSVIALFIEPKNICFLCFVVVIYGLFDIWIKINIREFLKSYFIIFFFILFLITCTGLYITYGIDTSQLVMPEPKEVANFSPEEYKVYNYLTFLLKSLRLFQLLLYICVRHYGIII